MYVGCCSVCPSSFLLFVAVCLLFVGAVALYHASVSETIGRTGAAVRPIARTIAEGARIGRIGGAHPSWTRGQSLTRWRPPHIFKRFAPKRICCHVLIWGFWRSSGEFSNIRVPVFGCFAWPVDDWGSLKSILLHNQNKWVICILFNTISIRSATH